MSEYTNWTVEFSAVDAVPGAQNRASNERNYPIWKGGWVRECLEYLSFVSEVFQSR